MLRDGVIAPCTLNLSSKCTWVFNFTSPPFHRRCKKPGISRIGDYAGYRIRVNAVGPALVSKSDGPVPNLVTVRKLTQLHCLKVFTDIKLTKFLCISNIIETLCKQHACCLVTALHVNQVRLLSHGGWVSDSAVQLPHLAVVAQLGEEGGGYGCGYKAQYLSNCSLTLYLLRWSSLHKAKEGHTQVCALITIWSTYFRAFHIQGTWGLDLNSPRSTVLLYVLSSDY